MTQICRNCTKTNIKINNSYYSELYLVYYPCNSTNFISKQINLFSGSTGNTSQNIQVCVDDQYPDIYFSIDSQQIVLAPDIDYTIESIEDCSILCDDDSGGRSQFVTPTPTPSPTPTPTGCSECVTYQLDLHDADEDSYVLIKYKPCNSNDVRYIELSEGCPRQIICIKSNYEIVVNNRNDFIVNSVINLSEYCTNECDDNIKCGKNTLLPLLNEEELPTFKIFYYNNNELTIDGCLLNDCDGYDGFVLGWFFQNETTPRFTSGWNITENRAVNSIEYPDGITYNQPCDTGFTATVPEGLWRVKILRRFFYNNGVLYFVDSKKGSCNSRSFIDKNQYNLLDGITIVVYAGGSPIPSPTPTSTPASTPTPTPTPFLTGNTCYDCFNVKVSLDDDYANATRLYRYIYVSCVGDSRGSIVSKTISKGDIQTVCVLGIPTNSENGGLFTSPPNVDNYNFLIRPYEEVNLLGFKDNIAFLIQPNYTLDSGTTVASPVICVEDLCVNISDEIKNAFINPRPLSFGVEEDVEGI